MTSCYSRYWVTTPAFRLDQTAVIAAAGDDKEPFGYAWSVSQRHGGGDFSGAMLTELARESPPQLSNMSSDEPREYRVFANDLIGEMYRLCLPSSIPEYGSSPIFSPSNDEDEQFWRRTGYELHQYQANYDILRRIPASDPHPKTNRKSKNPHSIDDNGPDVIEWRKKDPGITDPYFPEATGGYGGSRRGLTSKERLLYLANTYFASKPGLWETPDFKAIANEVRKLGKDELPERQKEQLGRTLSFRLEQNTKAQQYVDALKLHRIPKIKDWAMHLYGKIKEEGSDEDVTVGIKALARQIVPIIEKERLFHAPEMHQPEITIWMCGEDPTAGSRLSTSLAPWLLRDTRSLMLNMASRN